MSAVRYDLDAVRMAAPLAEIVGRDVDWDLRKSTPARGDYWACCPFHGEKTPSFHVVDRGADSFFHCFGCQAKGDVFGYVMQRDGVAFGEALRRLAMDGGVSGGVDPAVEARRERERAARAAEQRSDEARALATAEDIWREAVVDHAMLRAYLDARIGGRRRAALWEAYGAPSQLALHPALPHFAQVSGGFSHVAHTGPAMIGRVSRDRRISGVHRTWVMAQGRARYRQGGKIPKQMRGPCYGGIIPLTPFAPRLIVGEGIETTLAYLGEMALRPGFDPSSIAAASALSLGAITGAQTRSEGRGEAPTTLPDFDRPGWVCPSGVTELILLGDGSAKNPEEATRRMALAERRHRCDGAGQVIRSCRIAWPPDAHRRGIDWADWAAEQDKERC